MSASFFSTSCSFNSRPSCNGRHSPFRMSGGHSSFNSRPSCNGRHLKPIIRLVLSVSIHARRVTGDTLGYTMLTNLVVSIHARRVTGDLNSQYCSRLCCFNSRPSCNGRPTRARAAHHHKRFNSRPSCNGRPVLENAMPMQGVSIHARRVTGDCACW